MPLTRSFSLLLVLVATLVAGACGKGWKLSNYRTHDALYAEAMRQFQARKWDNAIAAFERLTQQLPARDPRMPISLFHLARAHEQKREYILAATTYARVSESFPDDSLADDAIYRAGRAYSQLWRKPSLDASYGETAINTYRTLLAIYPNSDLRDDAQQEVDRLERMFADKTFENGMHYYRRKAYESSLIYFTDVVRLYPETRTARDALMQMVRAYRRINYQAEARETCVDLQQRYAGDTAVSELCAFARPETPSTAASPTP